MRNSAITLLALAILPVSAMAIEGFAHSTPQTGQTIIAKTISPDSKAAIDVISASGNNTLASMPAQAAAEQFQVKIIIDPDADGKNKTPQGVWLIKDNYISYQSMRKAENIFSVPAGDYMAQIIFTNNDDAGAILFLPDIKVDGPKEIHANASMADKTITTAFTLPSGEKAILPEDNGFGGVADKPYNVKIITADIHLTYNGISKGSLQSVIGMGGADYSDLLTVRTNVDSQFGEISYVVKAEGAGKTGATYFYLASTTMDKVENSIVLENDPGYFHKLSTTDIARTPAYDTFGNGNGVLGINFYAYSPEASFVGGFGAELDSKRDLYICTPPIDFSVLHPLTQLYTYDYSDDDNWIYDGVATPFFAYSDKGIEYYAMQEGNAYKSDKPEWETLPYNPALTFSPAQDIKFGDNFAVCVTAVQYDPWADVPFSYIAPDCYYGNYGENRKIDVHVVENAVKYNGQLQDLGSDNDLYSWAENWAKTDHAPGEMSYIFTNKNIVIDGIQGQNICEVKYTEGQEDTTPPTLQRIMMRNAGGEVTNKFTSPDGATINIVGGDFVEKEESRDTGSWDMTFSYYTFADVDCKVEYAPFGSDEYRPFEVKADPEKFFMPGFGEYLSGSLDQVDITSSNGWYDLKVTLTDKAGNTQTQTISPAFKLDKLSGIQNITSNGFGFVVVNNSIASIDGSEVEVFNLTGAKIANENLCPGIYIVKNSSTGAKIVVK